LLRVKATSQVCFGRSGGLKMAISERMPVSVQVSVKAGALLVFLFLALTPAVGSEAEHHGYPRAGNPPRITEKDIPNFHQVDADLFRGGHPHCTGYAKLAALGIRTIVDLQGGADRAVRGCERRLGRTTLNFHIIPFEIMFTQTALTGVSDKRLRWLFAMMRRAPKPIFVTCKLGDDRTGVIVALYRMRRGEMSFQNAEQEALHYHFHPDVLVGLRFTLDRYRDRRKVSALPDP